MSSADYNSDEEEYQEQPHDLDELHEKCDDAIPNFSSLLMSLAFGRFTLEQTKKIVGCMGRAQINIGDGLTLLHQAAQFNHAAIVDYLIQQGHPLDVRTSLGETPLDQACWRGCIDTAVILLKHGADRDCQTKGGFSPLMRCAYYGHPRIASMLMLAGADPTLKDKKGLTAYDHAVDQGHAQIVKALTPLLDSEGNNIGKQMYARNNPKHPEYRKEATDALWSLFLAEKQLTRAHADEEADEDQDNDSDEWKALEEQAARADKAQADAKKDKETPPTA